MDGTQAGAQPRTPNATPGAPTAMAIRAASAQPSTFNAEARTVEVVFTTGADVVRKDWWNGESWVERLEVSPEAVDLGRLNSGAPVLDSHQSWELANVIGVVERAWITGTEGRALVRFSERDDVQPIVRDVQAGILRNISAGYWVSEWRIQEASDGKPKMKTATRWTPGEISFVPVPADPAAQVRAGHAPPSTRGPAGPHNPEVPMDTTQPGAQSAPPTTTPPAIDVEAERRAVRETEVARARDIRVAGKGLGLAEFAEDLVGRGCTLAEAQGLLITRMAEQRADAPKIKAPIVDVLRDEGDTARDGLRVALLHRAGHLRDDKGAQVALPDIARPYRGMRMLDFAGECVRLRGGNVRGLTPAEVAQAALGNREMMSRAGVGAHSITDFPNLLANTASKAMGNGYTSARRTFSLWARRRTLPDFKSFRVVNLSGAPQLQAISPTGADAGEITFGTIGEGAETYQLFRAGRRVAITFEAIVNDDMDGFARVPQMFGVAAARLESDTVYTILNSNPNMSDANALFGTAHVNVFGNGVAGFSAGDGVLNVTGLGVGRRVLRTQTAPNADILDLVPTYLLVPAALEAAALQFTSMSYVASAPGNLNPFANTLTPIVEPRLASAVQWFLIADTAEVDTVEYAYLEGMEMPQITTYTDPDTDGVVVKATHSFGAKATDWRGMVRSTGT